MARVVTIRVHLRSSLLFLSILVLIGVPICQVATGLQGGTEDLPLASQQIVSWLGPDGSPLPFQSNSEIEEFLKTAEVTSMDSVPTGINKVKKVQLKQDGVQINAVFRDVRVQKNKVKTQSGWRLDFRDDCRYECAAYHLSKLLGMDCVPPAVVRKIRGKTGTIQIWIERAKMESERLEEKLNPPDKKQWYRQVQTMRLFDNLIHNDDRNQGNLLIDEDWKIWLIDHTRAFRTIQDPPTPQLVRNCDRNLWENLKALTADDLESSLEDYLRDVELEAILKRRDVLVEHLQGEIAKRGSDSVLF